MEKENRILKKQVKIDKPLRLYICELENHFCYMYGLWHLEVWLDFSELKLKEAKEQYEDFYISYLKENDYCFDIEQINGITELNMKYTYGIWLTIVVNNVLPEYRNMFTEFLEKARQIESELSNK